MNGGPATRTLTRCSASKRSELCRSFAICCPLFILSAWRSWRAPKHARLARFRGDALVLPAPPRRAAGGHGRRVESTGSVARPTGCHLFRGIGRHELLTIAPGVCRWRRCALRCARTPPARAHARALPTDADADREIAALTKKIAADEASLVEDRKVILRHARSTSLRARASRHRGRACLARLCGPTLAAGPARQRPRRAPTPAPARARRSASCSSRSASCAASRRPRRRSSSGRRRSRRGSRSPAAPAHPDPDPNPNPNRNPNPNPNPHANPRSPAEPDLNLNP